MTNEQNKSSIRDLAMGKLSPEESLKILEEVQRNVEASEELDVAVDLMNFIATQGDEVFGRERKTVLERKSTTKRIVWILQAFWRPRWLAYPLVALTVVIGALLVANSLVTSKYYPLTKIGRLEFESRVRGPGLEDFRMAYEAFSEGEYDETIRLLERFIRAFPQNELVDYAHYSIGATCLVSSKRSFLTLFPSIDRDRVNRGMNHLHVVIQESSNARTIEDSHWLKAKGYLMLGEPEKSIAELQIIEAKSGLKRRQATRQISKIREILKGD